MKTKNIPKKYKTVWTCDYCGKEFKTKKLSDTHELTCPKKNREITIKIKAPTRDAMFLFGSVFIVLYFLIYFVVSSYAESNGFPSRDLLQPHKWFKSEPTPTTTPLPTPTNVPTPTAIPTLKPKTKVTTNSTTATENNIECIGPDGKHFNTSMTECEKLNKTWNKPVDYMVICDIPPECGGGSKRVPKSECTTCNRTTTNSNNTNNTNTSNYVMVALYGDMPVWCKPEVVQALKDMEVTMREKSKLWADSCVSVAEPPSSCIYLKDEANRTEDAYKNTFMHNCVNKK